MFFPAITRHKRRSVYRFVLNSPNVVHSGKLTIVPSAHESAAHEKFQFVQGAFPYMWHHSAGLSDISNAKKTTRNGVSGDEAKSKVY